MPLWYGWGYKPPLTASHIHIGCVYSDWAPSYAVDGHMDAPLHCYTCAGGGQILGNWGKVEPKWHGVMVEAVSHHWLHPTSILEVYNVLKHLHMLWMGIWVHPYTVIHLCRWGQNFVNLGKGEAKMMLWCHGWGCKPPMTASHIHISFIESVWGPSYAVDGHMDAPLHRYTCAGDGQILGNWGKGNPIWHCGVMVEAVNHHWLHPTFILDVYKVIEHLHMLWMGIWMHPYTVIYHIGIIQRI